MKSDRSFDFKYGSIKLLDSCAENLCSSTDVTNVRTRDMRPE